jgi:hypothetical protein
MDTFGDVEFRALAVMVWLIIAVGTLRVMLVPTVLVFAARRVKLRSPDWVRYALFATVAALFLSYAGHLLSFYPVQQWFGTVPIGVLSVAAFVCSIAESVAFLALASVIFKLTSSIQRKIGEQG